MDSEPKMTLQEQVQIHDESDDASKRKRAILPSPIPSNALPSFAISPCTSSSHEEATTLFDISSNHTAEHTASSCLLPLAFDVVRGSEKVAKITSQNILLSTNQSTTNIDKVIQPNFNPYQLNVSPVPIGESSPSPVASPTRTLSHYNCSLDIILENQSVSAFNRTNNQCLAEKLAATQRKYSLDTACMSRCSYYNKYFECYTFNKYRDSIREREVSCRRFSAPTPIPSSSTSSAILSTTTTSRERLGNTLFLGLSDPNLCSNRLSMCNNPPCGSSNIKEEPNSDPLTDIIKPKIKPRKIFDLCFTPSIDKADKLAFQINAKICHKCGCASSKL